MGTHIENTNKTKRKEKDAAQYERDRLERKSSAQRKRQLSQIREQELDEELDDGFDDHDMNY